MARRGIANHLDKILQTNCSHPGVQLKRTGVLERTSYQVESKVKGASPPRNVNFGCYDALEKAKRAFNMGSFIMGTRCEDLAYDFADNEDIESFCRGPMKEDMCRAVADNHQDGIVKMRDFIKRYVANCDCAEDSKEFKTIVFKYFMEATKQVKTRHLVRGEADGGDASRPSPELVHRSPRLAATAMAADATAAPVGVEEEQHAQEPNQTHDAPHPIAVNSDESQSSQRLKRTYRRQDAPDIDGATCVDNPDYTDLPPHFYGIIAHNGSLGTHEYPPQMDCSGTFACPSFFNHNFNTRSSRRTKCTPSEARRAVMAGIRENHAGVRGSLIVSTSSVSYNYEGGECVQEYYEGLLPLLYINEFDNVEEFTTDYSIYDKIDAENERGERATDQMQEEAAMNQMQQAFTNPMQGCHPRLLVLPDGGLAMSDLRITAGGQLISQGENGAWFLYDSLTGDVEGIRWDEHGAFEFWDLETGQWVKKCFFLDPETNLWHLMREL